MRGTCRVPVFAVTSLRVGSGANVRPAKGAVVETGASQRNGQRPQSPETSFQTPAPAGFSAAIPACFHVHPKCDGITEMAAASSITAAAGSKRKCGRTSSNVHVQTSRSPSRPSPTRHQFKIMFEVQPCVCFLLLTGGLKPH